MSTMDSDEDEDPHHEDMQEDKNIEWIDHKSASNNIWKHFLRSSSKKGKRNRFVAKCWHCKQVMDGKPQKMNKHLISICTLINHDDRASVMLCSKKMKSGYYICF